MPTESPPWDSVVTVDPAPLVVTVRHFAIVLVKDDEFEVGIADGVYPWRHLATCSTKDAANQICTLLAMHYRVRAHHVA